MKVAIITDQHFGARSDNLAFHDYFERFYSTIFFPYLKNNNIDTVIMGGDTYDRRKYINYNSLYRSKKYYFEPAEAHELKIHMLIGNHDTYYKNTNRINSPSLLLGEFKNLNIYSGPKTINLGGVDIAMLPWICSENYEESMEFIDKTPASVLFGHLELKGFQMHKGSPSFHGMSSNVFSKFLLVCSGHYHHKSTVGNINYLGAPYEMSWSDFDDPRGFHVLDTETLEIEFVQNPLTMFNKIHYDDINKTMEEVVESIDYEAFKNTYVKLIIHNKTNPYWFDLVIDRLERVGVIDLQSVEDNLNLDLTDDEDLVADAEDTLTVLNKVVDQLPYTDRLKNDLAPFLSSLYHEATSIE